MNDLMKNIWVWVGIVIVELILIVVVRNYQKKPVDPLRPRLIPLNFVFLALVIITFATMAHCVSIYTGVPVKPKSKMGIR